MREQLMQLLAQIRGAWRFRWLALVVSWLVALAGWLAVAFIPNQYEARAKIFVDTESVLKPLLQGLAVNTDVMNQVNMMARVMTSRPNLEKVAQVTDLYLRAPTPEQFQRLIDDLPKRVGLNGGGGNVFSVSFQDNDPQMAFRIVKTLVDTFVESAIGIKREDSTGAQKFLREELNNVDQKLREAEDRLAQFKKEKVGLMPGQTGDYYQRRQAASDELAKVKALYSIAEQRRDEVRRQLQGEEPTFGLFNGGVTTRSSKPVTAVDAKVAELEREKERLLLEYTDKHPRVQAIDETIKQLRERKETDPPVTPPTPESDPTRIAARALDVNPVYQSMKISLSQAELEVVELRNKMAQQQQAVFDLQSKVNVIPEVEAELARLNRDYDFNRGQYQLLLQRLESARLSEQAEDSREQIKFRVIEPPALPLVPLGPNRTLLASGVFVVAVGIGAALALLMNLLKPVFADRLTLSKAAEVPVLGVITLARTSAAIDRKAFLWIGGVGGLGLVFLTMLVMASRLAATLSGVAR